jgi:hypothetical protein
MSQDDNQKRYEDILKRIADRKSIKQDQTEQKVKTAYDLILDSLNVYDRIATLPQRNYQHILCYGPQVVRHDSSSGVVIWYRKKGYYGYQLLHLMGIWAHQYKEGIKLTIGIRDLPYRAATYNPEGYHATIRKGFTLFYEDYGHPPDEQDTVLFQSNYQQKERLTLRQTLPKILHQWQVEIDA